MKLAEALILRADYQRRIEQLKDRIQRNAKAQEGDQPSEDPNGLLEELERVAGDLMAMIQRINATNANTFFQQGETLADTLAKRDVLKLRMEAYRALTRAATVTQERYSRSEVKFNSAVNVVEIQKRADALAKEYRELDAKIQEANWLTDLRE
jgi:hypothetical protein